MPKIIAVAGPSGSGKTTIANKLLEHYGEEQCLLISSDNYYLDLSNMDPEKRDLVNFDHPDSIEFELLAEHLQMLRNGESVSIPTYDFATHTRTAETITASPKPIIIIEGILIQYPECLKTLYDTKIYVDTAPDICFIRRLERDVRERGRTMEHVITQYKRDVKPMLEAFVAPCKEKATIIIENNDDNFTTDEGIEFDMSMIIEHIENDTPLSEAARYRLFTHPASTGGVPMISMVPSTPMFS